ncbi:response regulator [Bradyrhizobium sp. 31Argb]|uniref:response regulator n=1 Tax=Bradyrhizobium TaxID=374 RepID=UPI000489BDCA|nr:MULTISPECIES: response regulator [Bradyrhizobium]TAI61682.1 response regulator [Bradyrhizobium sp. Leo170]
MQAKSPVDLVQMAHALDVVSIVDRDASVNQALTDVLLSTSDNPEPFQCADELKSNRPLSTSCLIADVQLPGVAGLELCQHSAASGKADLTILLTSRPGDNHWLRALRASVSHSLVKPFIGSELLACVKSTLECRSAQRRHP